MAITFEDLYAESGLKSLDDFLAGKTYISGDGLTTDDIKVFAAVSGKPGGGFSNAGKWYDTVESHLAASFPGKALGVKIVGSAVPADATVVEAVTQAAEADDDDLDLFGDETEEDKKAAEEREAAIKASSKKKERVSFLGLLLLAAVNDGQPGCLLPSLPTDVVYDNLTGFGFTCDSSDNVEAPWPLSSFTSFSLCASEMSLPARPTSGTWKHSGVFPGSLGFLFFFPVQFVMYFFLS